MKLLFLCTANSCRSILSEALFNHVAPPGMRAWSAGSFPSGKVNPTALAALAARGVDTAGLSSKGNDAHVELHPDLVVTVCDRAAGEACPVWFGDALRAHWGLADPSEVGGSEAEIAAAFDRTIAIIQSRVRAFLDGRPTELDRDALARLAERIGQVG